MGTKTITVSVGGHMTQDRQVVKQVRVALMVNEAGLDRLAQLVQLCVDNKLSAAEVEGGVRWYPLGIAASCSEPVDATVVQDVGTFWVLNRTILNSTSEQVIETQPVKLEVLRTAFEASKDGAVVNLDAFTAQEDMATRSR